MPRISDLIDRAASWFSGAEAVTEGNRQLTFQQVGQRSSRLANVLCGLDPELGSRVAVLVPNRLESVEIDFAIAKAGKVRVPINPRLVDDERAYILANAGATTLVVDSEFEPFIVSARSGMPDLRHVIAIGSAVEGASKYEDLLANASEVKPAIDHNPDALSYILYTSGTTGRPKGAAATNRSRLAATMNMLIDEIDPKPGDGMVHVGSMAHGSGSKVLAYFIRGARNLPVAKYEPDRFLDLVARERATATFMVPTMISTLVEAAKMARSSAGTLKTITYGGAPIATEKLEEALERFGPVFVQVYGSCEAPHPILVLKKADHAIENNRDRHRLSSAGREVVTVEVKLFSEIGRDLINGEPGEMWIRSAGLMRGYWQDMAATELVMTDGWYHTGDVFVRDDQGFYYVVDRVRDMIITGGLNVYPAEVEAAMYKHPAIAEVAVVGVPDEHWGESVKAFVTLKPGASLSEAELIEHARKHLAGYKKPRSVEFRDELPKGSTGKILKRELKAPFWTSTTRRVN